MYKCVVHLLLLTAYVCAALCVISWAWKSLVVPDLLGRMDEMHLQMGDTNKLLRAIDTHAADLQGQAAAITNDKYR